MSTYTVVGPVVTIKDEVGKLRYYYHGSPVPSDLPADELKRLTAIGLIAKSEPQIVPGLPVAGGSGGQVVRPRDAATKAAWVEYRITPLGGGHDRAEAEKLTRDELVALDGPPA